MLIQINTNIVATTKDLILVQSFHLQMEALKNGIIFRADMSPYVHIANKDKGILLILVKGPKLTAGAAEVTVSYLLMLHKYENSKQNNLK